MKDLAEEIAKLLLDVQAVQFNFENPYKWSSGWNSPVYCDSRLTLSYPAIRTFIKNAFVLLIQENYPQVEALAGVATAGIPQSALIADALELPMVYVRPKPKEHGKENLIEGKIVAGQKVVIVEDIISTGKSTIQAALALREAGFDVLGAVAIYSYGFEFAHQSLRENDLDFKTLSAYPQLLVEIAKRQDIDEKTMASLHAWRKNPETWQPD